MFLFFEELFTLINIPWVLLSEFATLAFCDLLKMRLPGQSQITEETVEEDHREETEKAKSDNAESTLDAEPVKERAVGNFAKNLWNRAYHQLHVGMDLFEEFHKIIVPPLPGISPIYAIENPHNLSIRKRAFCMNVNLAYRILIYLGTYSCLSLMKFCNSVQDCLGISRCSLQISKESLSLHFGPFNIDIKWKLQMGLPQTTEDPPRTEETQDSVIDKKALEI